MKYERIAKGANGRRWKITHELLAGPAPKGKKAKRTRTAKPDGKKATKKRAAKGTKTPRRATKGATKTAKSAPTKKRAQGSAKRSPKPEQLRLILLG